MLRWLFIILLAVWSSPVLGADITPPSPSPPPSIPKDQSADKPIPDSLPSTRDPGMVKQPETVPHPDSVVTPPVIDPKMAVDPEAKTEKERHPTVSPGQPSPPKQ